jgi:hypothetical protein
MQKSKRLLQGGMTLLQPLPSYGDFLRRHFREWEVGIPHGTGVHLDKGFPCHRVGIRNVEDFPHGARVFGGK